MAQSQAVFRNYKENHLITVSQKKMKCERMPSETRFQSLVLLQFMLHTKDLEAHPRHSMNIFAILVGSYLNCYSCHTRHSLNSLWINKSTEKRLEKFILYQSQEFISFKRNSLFLFSTISSKQQDLKQK